MNRLFVTGASNWTILVRLQVGHDVWIFHPGKIARTGFWSMAHEARADIDMLLGYIYLLIEGAGAWSIDAIFFSGRRS